MEKIKKALERAKETQGVTNKSNKLIQENQIGQLSYIKYTKTRVLKVSKTILENKKVIVGDSNGVISDQYKVLRTQVLHRLKSNQWNSLIITSPTEGCGKTLTSINLAISLAREVNHSVLLVDLDLRRPCIHKYFYEDKNLGISDYLIKNYDLDEILFNPGFERLVVLPGNESVSNSSETLSSPKMVSLVNELKSRYPNRIVIFDMPPLLSCDDVIAFKPYVDSIMLVIEEGRTTKEELIRSHNLLENEKIIGTVLNKACIKEQAYS
ncbi:MAG: CpsD/CapB family tyrosine-protein kinase [Candidatus Thiodiazotropha sp. (ex. Lucinisca nassula)]|nr:CpsD/CapB family tyrosine-protein kinase [Candidatus Thiodiazotropha sp. (ex. Lucinisca nassula)]